MSGVHVALPSPSCGHAAWVDCFWNLHPTELQSRLHEHVVQADAEVIEPLLTSQAKLAEQITRVLACECRVRQCRSQREIAEQWTNFLRGDNT